MNRIKILLLAAIAIMAVGCNQNPPESVSETEYTMIVYTTIGGKMDYLMEGAWEETQKQLPDGKVRVFWVHKYGRAEGFKAKYGQPGEVVAFELTKDTKFEEVAKTGKIDTTFALYDPQNLTRVIDWAAEQAPAKEYVLTLYGHGSGFDLSTDFPKEWSESSQAPGRVKNGILYDKWLEGSPGMNMYELAEAITNSRIKHFKAILLHSCLAGGMETLMQVKQYADYMFASPFLMTSEDTPMIPMLAKNMHEKDNFEEAARQSIIDSEARMKNGFQHEDPDYVNGNMELLKSSELDAICQATKKLSERLCALYPTQKAAIDTATNHVYRFYSRDAYYDLLDYARLLAKETGDAQLQSIQQEMEQAFGKAILQQLTVDLERLPALPSYSLSVVLTSRPDYNETVPNQSFSLKQVYEQCVFHQITHWGDWLDTNQQRPQGNPCGQVM